MKLNSDKIITELTDLTNKLRADAIILKSLDAESLNRKSSNESWSALECLDHLVQYGDYYNNELLRRVKSSKTIPSKEFSTGMIGNYFAKMMIPKEGMKKMKSPKDKIPRKSNLTPELIEAFIAQQDQLLLILEKAKSVNLGNVKCSITLSRFIKLKLGDTLRFVIYHNWRHMEQAKKATSLRI